jgi:GNAT superfamily N-acetyltransferase
MTASALSPAPAVTPAATVSLVDGRIVTIVRARACEPHEVVLEARAGDEVVGLACCELDPPRRSGRLSVSVAPAWRNVGLGRGLVQQMVEEARALGLLYLAGRHAPSDSAAARMVAGTGAIVARRTGDGLVRVAIAVPHVVPDAA